MTKATRARYTLEFKREAVRLVQSGQSLAAAARTLGVVATCGGVAVAVGRAGCGSRALWLVTCAWFLLASGGYAGSSWLTSFAIHGSWVLDRADLACRSLPRRFVDANEEFRCAGYRARCR
jgi:hypothetical protein